MIMDANQTLFLFQYRLYYNEYSINTFAKNRLSWKKFCSKVEFFTTTAQTPKSIQRTF
jgi:hypothetical protein